MTPAGEPAGAPAGEPAGEGGGERRSLVEEITVAAPGRLPGDRAAGDGLTVLVVGPEELGGSGARTLQEALQRIPGAHLADEQGNSFQQDLQVRGFTASPVTGLPQGLSVFVDGVRVNEPAVEEVNFDLVPLSDVERVEIIRGASAVHGRNTLGGAIHVITRRGGREPEAEVEIQGGSWSFQLVRGRISGPVGPLDAYLSLTESSERGWRAVGGARMLRALGKLGLRREDTDLTLSYQVQRDRLEQPGSLPRSMLEQDRRQNYTAGDFFRPRLHLVSLGARRSLAPDLSLAVNGFFRALDGEQYNSSRLAPDTRLFNRTRSAGATAQLDHRSRLGALRNRIAAGAEAASSAVHIAVHQEPNAGFSSTGSGVPLPALTSDLSDRQLALGAFLQGQMGFAEGPLAGLGATLAVRFDRVEHRIVDASPESPGSATGSRAFSSWIPAAGLSWAFGPRWLASVSYGEGFRAPAFLELTCADPAAPCVGLQAGVAPDTGLGLLRPVRSLAYQAGAAGSPWSGVTASLDLFRIDLRDDIFSVVPPPAPGAPGTNRVVFQNVGDTRRQGLALALGVRRGPVEIQAGYAYTRATFESRLDLPTPRTSDGGQAVRPGDRIPLAPDHRVDLEGRVRPLEWLALSAGLRYVGFQRLRGDEANEAPGLAPYLLVRAGARVRSGPWSASLRAENLLGLDHESFGTFAADGRAPAAPVVPFLTPGPPRRLVLELRWELDSSGFTPAP